MILYDLFIYACMFSPVHAQTPQAREQDLQCQTHLMVAKCMGGVWLAAASASSWPLA